MAESLSEFAQSLLGMIEKGVIATDRSLQKTALKVEAEMKRTVREGGAHKFGTKTSARPGSGPAVISGDLSRSITHEKSRDGYRIGPASIPHTKYGSRSGRANARQSPARTLRGGAGTTSGQIGKWLEGGTENMPAYPFVQPALDAVKDEIAETFREVFEGERW